MAERTRGESAFGVMRGEIERPAARFARVCTAHNQVLEEDPLEDRLRCPAGHDMGKRDGYAVVKMRREVYVPPPPKRRRRRAA